MIKLLMPFLLLPCMIAADKEPVCKKCQMIREYNAAHPENNYFWYDDYVKDQEKKKQGDDAATASTDKAADKETKKK